MNSTHFTNPKSFVVVVPAAGVGKRMQSHCPKQYLTIDGKSILDHTVLKLLSHEAIQHVVVVISKEDEYFSDTLIANHPQVSTVYGGKERVDSVLAGLKTINNQTYPWVLVHDAARPCITKEDINSLITHCLHHQEGGLLAYQVRDTMKSSNSNLQVEITVDRETLWHALTPQMYLVDDLISAIEFSLEKKLTITDESSAIEYFNLPSHLVAGRSDNIKITRPDDLAMAQFILANQNSQEM